MSPTDPAPGAPPRGSTGKKLLLVAFGLAAAVLLLAAAEGVLALLGAGDSRLYEDPFVGFAPGRDLFSLHPGPGGVYATNPGKLAFFNPQEFPAVKAPGAYRVFALGGSTTAGRPYDATVAFPHWLELYLHAMDPQRRWEVINAGAISYASYRVVVLMRELVRYQPDLFVIYTGHNEFLEERTYSAIIHEPPWRQRLRRALSRLRLYNVVRAGLGALRRGKAPPENLLPGEVTTRLEGWTGLDRYHRDPELARAVVEHFTYNLHQMVALARDHGAEVVFVVPASNLKDFSPFKSEHGRPLAAPELASFEQLLGRGKALLAAGDATGARGVLEQAKAIDPDYAEVRFRLGRARLAAGDADGALADFIAAKDLDVAPLRALEAIAAAVRSVAREESAEAIDLPAILAADCRRRLGYPIPGDEDFLDHVHPDIPVHSLLAARLADLLASRGVARRGTGASAERRREIQDRLVASLDRQYFAHKDLNLATVLGWAGKFEEAEGPLLRAAEVLPASPELHLDLGIVYQRTGRPAAAVPELERAVELAPGLARARFNLGVVYARLGRLGDGVAALEEAIRLQPDYAEAYQDLGVLERRRGHLAEAEKALARARELQPRAPEVYDALGLVYRRQGRTEEAVAAFEKARELAPGNATAAVDLGVTYARSDRLDDAARVLEEAIARRPLDAEALYNLGLVRSRQGRPDEALAAYRRAVEADPGHARARNNLGILLASRGEGEEAGRQLRAAVAADPDYAEAHFNLGVLLDGAGHPDEALAEVERAVALAPDEARFHQALGLLYGARGRREEARRQQALAAEKAPQAVAASPP